MRYVTDLSILVVLDSSLFIHIRIIYIVHCTAIFDYFWVFKIWYLTNYSLPKYTKELTERSLLLLVLSLSLFKTALLCYSEFPCPFTSIVLKYAGVCDGVWGCPLVTILSQWRLQFYMNISCCWNWNLVFPVCVFVNKRIKAFCVIMLKKILYRSRTPIT